MEQSIPFARAKNAPRIIKKYPNRRLYDTEQSAYVTLAQIRELVLNRVPLVVQDSKSGDDLTRSVLLQILLEEEAAGEPIFSEAALAEIIRFYGSAIHAFARSYMEKNIRAMVEMQEVLARQSLELTPELWTRFTRMQTLMMQSMLTGSLDGSRDAWTQLQKQMSAQAEQMFKAFGVFPSR